MEGKIKEKLLEIEREENVKILYAIEAGSRAWGFASQDSDYDVRFIYIRPMEEYLKLEKKRDVIEWQLDERLDINGWDLQKALRLAYKSNSTVFEWSNSNIIYKTTPQYEKIKEVVATYFQSKTTVYHYISMAKTNYMDLKKQEMVTYKKYFYVLRSILACKWILEKKCPPPIRIQDLLKGQIDQEMETLVFNLIEQKRSTKEKNKGDKIQELDCYIECELDNIMLQVAKLPNEEKKCWKQLDEAFLNALQ